MRIDYEGMDDRDLLARAEHDREAFAELYRRHIDGLIRYFGHALGRSDLAFDLAAETFAAALIALPNYRPSAAPGKSWLYAIAHNRLVDSVRKGKAESKARDELEMQAIVLDEHGEAIVDEIVARMDGSTVLELVNELQRDQRDAITARFFEHKDYAEIASAMVCSEQVVRKRVSRGLENLRKRLEDERI